MKRYFYTDGKDKFGPFKKEELKNESLNRNTLVWYYGLENWTKISELEELDDIISSLPPEIRIEENEILEKEKDFTNTKNKAPKRKIRWGWIIIFVIISIGYFAKNIKDKPSTANNTYLHILMNSYGTTEGFQMYVDKFYRDVNYYGIFPKKPKETIIRFSKLDQMDNLTHIHAMSFGANKDEKIEIYINPSSWDEFNKPMRYFLIYHELAHDVLNLDDLENIPENKGKLMFPAISSYEGITMDDFIKAFQELFEEVGENQNTLKIKNEPEISKIDAINYMNNIVKITNEVLSLPTQIEDYMVAEKVTFDSNKMILTYTYTIATDSIDMADWKNVEKQIEIEQIKNAHNLYKEDKNYKLLQVNIKSIYQDSYGKEFFSFNITPEQYLQSTTP